MAFKYVPDYWVFQSMADTDMFQWRAALEQRLDDLHDQTAAKLFKGKASVQDDVQRHRQWSEALKGSSLSAEELADLQHMLSVRGVLPQPGYQDKPKRGVASKAGGGRTQRKVMRGRGEEGSQAVVEAPGTPQSDVEARYWAEIEREQARQDKLYDEAMEDYYKQQAIVDPMAELRAEQVKFEVDNGLWYPSPEHSDAEV
eukprot:Skav228088  [mRNA]  locus=scaffold913:453422:454021:+ [translate_table: standard]